MIADHLKVEFYVYIIQLAILISRDSPGYITPATGVNFWPQVVLNADLSNTKMHSLLGKKFQRYELITILQITEIFKT